MTEQRYRTDFPSSCRTQVVDGMTLVFHRPSGTTHFLDSPVPDMLALLADAPDDAAGLARRLCARLDIPHDDEAQTVVAARLTELVDSGLVQAG